MAVARTLAFLCMIGISLTLPPRTTAGDQPQPSTTDRVIRDTKEAVEATKQYTLQQKETFQKAVQAELAEISLTSLPQLNLAIIDDLDASLTPVLVSALQKRFRKCFVYAFSGRSDQIIDRLQSRDADIGVTALLPADSTTFQSAPILREAFILVTAKGAIKHVSDGKKVDRWSRGSTRLGHAWHGTCGSGYYLVAPT